MSILLKDMEVPKSCDVCPFVKTNDDLQTDDYRYMYCGFPSIGEFVGDYVASRYKDCPLTPVPPHGRLIDADALLRDLDEAERAAVLPIGCYEQRHNDFDEAREAIEDAEVVIEAEGTP